MEKYDIADKDEKRYFFAHGLRFSCIQCGECCTGAPGIVRISTEEISALSEFLNIDKRRLLVEYINETVQGYAIRELDNGRCIFYNDGCLIYPVRPKQCRTFPFWLKNLRSREAWQKVSKMCPGTGNGKFYSFKEILELIDFDIK